MPDYVTSALAFAAAGVLNCGPRTRRLLTAAAAVNVAGNARTDHGVGLARKLPVVAHVNGDLACGVNLLLAAATYLRGEPPPGRRTTAALGAYHVAAAMLTAKPTGPARHLVVAPSGDPLASHPEFPEDRSPRLCSGR